MFITVEKSPILFSTELSNKFTKTRLRTVFARAKKVIFVKWHIQDVEVAVDSKFIRLTVWTRGCQASSYLKINILCLNWSCPFYISIKRKTDASTVVMPYTLWRLASQDEYFILVFYRTNINFSLFHGSLSSNGMAFLLQYTRIKLSSYCNKTSNSSIVTRIKPYDSNVRNVQKSFAVNSFLNESLKGFSRSWSLASELWISGPTRFVK